MSNGRHSYVYFYPSDWIGGTCRMTRIQRSVYHDICLYIWDKATPVPEAELPLMLGDFPDWAAIVELLVAARKLRRVEGGSLINDRALAEALAAQKRWSDKSAAGKTAMAKRWSDNKTVITQPLTEANSVNIEPEPEPERKEIPPTPQMQAAIELWNKLANNCGFGVVKKLNSERKRKLPARLRDANGLEGWKAALDKLAASSFCRGTNERGWRADFDFLLQEKSFTRLMEGFYDDRKGNTDETADRTTGPGIGYITGPKIDISKLDGHGNYIPELGGSRQTEENRPGRPLESALGRGQGETHSLRLRAQSDPGKPLGNERRHGRPVEKRGDDRSSDRAVPDEIQASNESVDPMNRANGSRQSGGESPPGPARPAVERKRLIAVTPEDRVKLMAAELIEDHSQMAPQMPEIPSPEPVEPRPCIFLPSEISEAPQGQIFEQRNYPPVDDDWPELPEFMRR